MAISKLFSFDDLKKIMIQPCRMFGDRGKYMTRCHIQEQRNRLVTKLS